MTATLQHGAAGRARHAEISCWKCVVFMSPGDNPKSLFGQWCTRVTRTICATRSIREAAPRTTVTVTTKDPYHG